MNESDSNEASINLGKKIPECYNECCQIRR